MEKNSAKLRFPSRFMIACLIIALFPITMLGYILISSQVTSGRESAMDMAQQRMATVSARFDRLTEHIQTIANHFSTEIDDEILMPADEIERQFRTYKETFSLRGELYLFIRGEQNIYSSDGIVPYAAFDSSSGFGPELGMISFYTKLNTLTSPLWLATQGLNGESNYFVCLYPIPMLSAAPRATLFYVLGNHEVYDYLHEYLGNFDGCFAVFDTSRRLSFLVNSSGHAQDATFRSELISLKGTQPVSRKIDGRQYTLFRSVPDNSSFIYTLADSDERLFGEVNRHCRNQIISLIGFLGIAVAVFIVIARWQSAPMRKLAKSMDIDDNALFTKAPGELIHDINEQYHRIQNENERLILQAHTYTDQVTRRVVQGMLEGRFRSQEALDDALKLAGMYFSYDSFLVMIVRLLPDSTAGTAEKVLQDFRNVSFRGGQAYSFDPKTADSAGIIINMAEDKSQDADTVRRRIGEQFSERLARLGYRPACIGISRIRHSALRLNQQLFEALAATDWQENGVGLFTQNKTGTQSYPFQECEMFRQSLSFGNEQTAWKAMNHIAETAAAEHWSTDKTQAIFFRLVNTLLMLCMGNGLQVDDTDLTHAASSAQADRLQAAMEQPVRKLCEMIGEQKNRAEEQNRSSIMEYIYEHCTDSDISGSLVAEKFSVSEETIRQIVRDETGLTFLNYVTMLRMAYVKKQLTETDLPIKDIVESAGYIDASSFTRKFKSTEGITPGQYRQATQARLS